jgi:hypothetical protein
MITLRVIAARSGILRVVGRFEATHLCCRRNARISPSSIPPACTGMNATPKTIRLKATDDPPHLKNEDENGSVRRKSQVSGAQLADEK